MAVSRRRRLHQVVRWVLAAAAWTALASCSGRCAGGKPTGASKEGAAPLGVVEPPKDATYPRRLDASAAQVLARLPADTQAVLLVASLGALVELANDVGRWGFIQLDNLVSIQRKLDLNYGINPWDLGAWRRVGFDVSGAVGLAKVGGNWVLAAAVEDPAGFERFIDGWINEEFGRPRPREVQAQGRVLKQTLVYARDFITTTCEAGYCYAVTGRYFDPAATDSATLLASLLTQPTSLAADPVLARQLASQGEGVALLYIPGRALSDQVTAWAQRIGLPEGLGAKLLSQVRGASVGLVTQRQSAQVRLLLDLPAEALTQVLGVVSAPAAPQRPLAALLPASPRGLLRLSFHPAQLEAWLLSFASDDAQARWAKLKRDKLKRKQGPFMLYDAEQELLYNLSGHALIALQRLDADALTLAAEDPELLLSAIDLAIYLPLQNPALSDSLFSKLDLAKSFILEDKSVKDMLKRNHASLDISAQDGAQVIALSRKGQPIVRLLYRAGTLAIMLGAGDAAPSIQRLPPAPSPGPWQPAPASAVAALLEASPAWGLSLDAADIASLLGARFKIIRAQIDYLLSPLQRVSVRARFEPQALGLDLNVELRDPPPSATP